MADPTTHLLSTKSREQGRDLFIFDVTPGCFGMRAGLNLGKYPDVTNFTLYRWIRLITGREKPFALFPIHVIKSRGLVLHFTPTLAGNLLTDNEERPLPGDYGAYETDTNSQLRASDVLRTVAAYPPATELFKSKVTYPISFEDQIRLRDLRCLITGVSDASMLKVTWIYPPRRAFELVEEWLTFDSSPYFRASNGILLHEALIKPFLENSLGIDVDDAYRIVVFKDLDHDVSILTYARVSLEYPPDVIDHLRQHFKRCLHVHFCGGDIWDQYDQRQVLTLMEDMGLCGGESELTPLDDHRWQTEIGKELLEAYMHSGMTNLSDEQIDEETNEYNHA